MLSEQLISPVHRLKGENLHVLAEDIERELSSASEGVAKSKVDVVLYDAILNDKAMLLLFSIVYYFL